MSWLRAARECHPKLRLAGFEALEKKLREALPSLSFQGGVGSREGFAKLAVRCSGPEADHARFRALLPKLLGKAVPIPRRAPGKGEPWLELVWDAKAGALAEAAVFELDAALTAAGRTPLAHRPAGSALWAELGLGPALEAFTALCPVESMVTRGGQWSLRLSPPAAWPHFCRTDLSAPFSAGSSQASFILRSSLVAELGFRDDSLWAFFEA